MKSPTQFCRNVSLVVLFNLCLTAASFADPAWSGHFSWTNRGLESEYGNVAQNVDLSIKEDNGNAAIGVTVSWRPGATVELGVAIPQSAITTEPGPNGNPTQVLVFTFTDGFQNQGTGRIVISGNTATISLDATETLEGRATRQYGDYTLTRRP